MTVGIYTLNFKGTNKVYVGQSVNIEVRYRVHKQKLKDGSHNYKMLEAYKLFGMPELKIVCECDTKEELNDLELEAFSIFDCIDNGFNIAREPDIHQEGELNGYSKITNDKVREVFHMLLDVDKYQTYKHIKEATGVSVSNIRHIANGDSHKWLEREMPEEYAKLKTIDRSSLGNSAKAMGIVYPKVISPEGVEYTVDIANAFARKHGMDPSYFIKLLNGKALSCKGWKVKK